MANAENLSCLVIYELAHPGRPFMYGSATGVMDFQSGAYLAGLPEMGLMSAALTAMARFYGLPSMAAGCTADANEPGPGAVLEKVISTLSPALLNADIIAGYGSVDGDQLLSLEQLVVDNEIAHLCRRVAQGVDAGEGKELLEDIRKAGPGGHFLASRNTRHAPRSGEFYISRLRQRASLQAWLEAGKPSVYSRARETVNQVLAGPWIDPLPEDVLAELEKVLRKADVELTAQAAA
jgi:trimethylamine--corrinoid protein Co-methyltransferase